jgi:hypothetical protein
VKGRGESLAPIPTREGDRVTTLELRTRLAAAIAFVAAIPVLATTAPLLALVGCAVLFVVALMAEAVLPRQPRRSAA